MTTCNYNSSGINRLTKQRNLEHSYRIFPTRFENPLGITPGDNRFCTQDSENKILYVARSFSTAVIEVAIRDRFELKETRELPLSKLYELSYSTISSVQDSNLSILDLRNNGCTLIGAPTDTVHSSDHSEGRRLGNYIYHHHTNIDGILFSSRFDGKEMYAIFDRGKSKLKASLPNPLRDKFSELKTILQDLDITITFIKEHNE